MAEMIQLPLDAGRRALVLEEANGLQWYSCVFVDGSTRVALGAENREYLVSHLRSALEQSTHADGTVAGRPVRWVLSLAEQHASVYVTVDEAHPTLIVQDSTGQTVAQATISPTDRDAWNALALPEIAASDLKRVGD